MECKPALLPILDISQLAACPDYDSDCRDMSVAAITACMAHDNPRLIGICVEMQRRQTGENCGRFA
mgnify:CR=1 FL=1